MSDNKKYQYVNVGRGDTVLRVLLTQYEHEHYMNEEKGNTT